LQHKIITSCKAKIIFIGGASFLYSTLALADDIMLTNYGRKGNETPQTISTIPFSVDVTFGHLTLHMTSANSLYMIITGPDGVVLMREVNATGDCHESFDLTLMIMATTKYIAYCGRQRQRCFR